jgi:hypothetical protein
MAYSVYEYREGVLNREELPTAPPIPVRNANPTLISTRPTVEVQPNTKTIRLRAQWPVSAHRFVTDGAEYVSSGHTFDANRVLGMTLNAANAGDIVTVAVLGFVSEPTWNLTPDLPIYLGDDGYMTQTPPTEGFHLTLGVALSPTSIYIDIDVPIFLI